MRSQTTLQLLEREFCPPLDSSLLAALLAEVEPNLNGDRLHSQAQIHNLRSTLRELAARADQDERQLSEQLSAVHLSDDTSGDNTTSSISSEPSGYSFSSPLGFLHAALPHMPIETLATALDHASDDTDAIDMETIVEELLTKEYLRELDERGLDDTNLVDFMDNEKHVRQTTKLGTSIRGSGNALKRKTNKRRILTLGDIRQTHTRGNSDTLRTVPALDPWTQLLSISTLLANLLPPHPPTLFQSCFHSPEYATPYEALRETLSSIAASRSDGGKHAASLFDLLDIIRPSYEDLDAEQRSRLIDDTQLALRVTQGRGEDALDLVRLLRDLDSSGSLVIGVHHTRPEISPLRASSKVLPPTAVPHTPKSWSTPSSPSTTKPPPDPFQWQSIPQRKTPRNNISDLAAFIPAYRNLPGNTHGDCSGTRGSGIGVSSGGKVDIGESEAQTCRRRMQQSTQQTKELLREASKAWGRGNIKSRGGEVAQYYAEEARRVQEAARKESLDASRRMVETKRALSPDGDIDIHGTTVKEAVIIVGEILQETNPSPQNPLRIITGRGKHSVKGVSVLKPAVKNALTQRGWRVGTWDSGLIVHGREDSVTH